MTTHPRDEVCADCGRPFVWTSTGRACDPPHPTSVTLGARTRATLPPRFTVKVAGVTFQPDYPANLYALNDAMTDHPDLPVPVELRRDPHNPHDTNAVEVHAGGYGMLGHFPAALAKRFAPEVDAGAVWRGYVQAVPHWPDGLHPERPGCVVVLERLP